MALSQFAQKMKAKAAAWKKAAKATPRAGSDFGPVNIPDDNYEAIVSAKYGETERGTNAGTPFAEFTATIADGEHQGKEPRSFYFLDGKMPSDDPEAMPTNEERLVGDLKQLLPDIDVEKVVSGDPTQVTSLLDEVESRRPKFRIRVRTRIGKKGTKGEGKKFQDVFFNQLLEGGTSNGQVSEQAPQESEVSEETVEEEEESSEEGFDEGGTVDTGDVAPAIGDTVLYKPKGARSSRQFEVKSVNNGKQTVTLSDGKKKYSNVPWGELE